MQKLIEALKTIKFECEKHGSCSECPLNDGKGRCLINGRTPEKWKIIEPKTFIRVME